MAKLTPTATFETFRVCLTEEGHVPFFDGPSYLGRGTWDKGKRRILDIPEAIPERAHRALSQGLRLSVTALKVRKTVKRQKVLDEYTRPVVSSLFREFHEHAFPSNFTRWAKFEFRLPYVAVVVAEQDVLIYRDWTLVGTAKWNPNIPCIEGYSGVSLQVTVWDNLVRRLTKYPVAKSKS